MGRPKLYDNDTERKRAQRQRQKDQAAATAPLALLQEEYAQRHLVVRFEVPHLQRHATAEQLQLQQERKEQNMLDVLWTLQTLIADFGYNEVERHVLQHVRPLTTSRQS